MTAYAIRHETTGQWWGPSWRGRRTFGPVSSARLYPTGTLALAAYQDHVRKRGCVPEPVEAVELRISTGDVWDRWPRR